MGTALMNPSVGPPDAGARFLGVEKTASVPAPAAGADWSYRVDGGTWQRILLASGTLTTSAAVANRVPRLTISDADGNIYYQWTVGIAQAAGATQRYSASITPLVGGIGGAGAGHLPMPALWLPAGFTLSTSTLLLDAGDQWSVIRLLVEELDRGPLGEQIGTDPNSAF